MHKKEVNTSFNLFLRDFDSIRDIFRYVFLYGCYDRYQFNNLTGYSKETYENHIKRFKKIVDDKCFSEDRKNRKQIISLKYNRYYNMFDYLMKSYNLRTFNKQDINLYFIILDIFYNDHINKNKTVVDKEDKNLSISEVITIIQDEYFKNSKDDNENISPRMIRDKMFELEDIGFLKETKKKYKNRDIRSFIKQKDILEEFNTDELLEIHKILYFFRGSSHLSVLANFIQETIYEFITQIKGDDCDNKDIFLFNNVFLNNILNENIIVKIIQSIEQRHKISFKLEKNKKNTIYVYPFKIIYEKQYGRQYLFCFNLSSKRPCTYNIDDIKNLKIEKYQTYDIKKYENCMKLINKFWSMTQLNEVKDPLNKKPLPVEIDFYIDESKKYIIERVNDEKRCGSLVKITDSHWKYSIYVIRVEEMIPWVRSFGEHAVVRKSDVHNLKEKVEDSWRELKKLYGLI